MNEEQAHYEIQENLLDKNEMKGMTNKKKMKETNFEIEIKKEAIRC